LAEIASRNPDFEIAFACRTIAMKKKPISNPEIARILFEMAVLSDMNDMEYKRRAYELASADVAIFPEELAQLYEREGLKGLRTVPSVGTQIAKHIEELLKTGRFGEYEKLKEKFPVDLGELLLVEGVGPKTIRDLWLRLGIKNLDDLEKACRAEKVRELPRFGIKSEEKLLKAVQDAKGIGTITIE
jgi:DNA polymerase (family 10)